MFDRLTDRVSVYEVSPRDGLQNERATVPPQDKLRLIDALVFAGLRRIEITSFVSPKWIPQLADADDVARLAMASCVGPPELPGPTVAPGDTPELRITPGDTPGAPGVTFSALCPNPRGLARAKAAGVHEIAVFLSASETHNLKNVNKSIDRTLATFEETVGPARGFGMRVRAYVSTVWGCPYEGEVDPDRAVSIAKRLLDMGCYQVSLGDTIGVATPKQTDAVVRRMLQYAKPEQVALHMHDTRGTALANVLVGLELGIRDFDASVGGLGGCPYAPGAAGNCATEDLVYMLAGMGIETGIDLDRLVEAGKVAESIVGHKLPGKVHQAGVRSLRA